MGIRELKQSSVKAQEQDQGVKGVKEGYQCEGQVLTIGQNPREKP